MTRPKSAPTHRFLARVTHEGLPQVCWAENFTNLSGNFVRAFVTLTPQEKCRGGWVFFSKWEVVTPRTVKEMS